MAKPPDVATRDFGTWLGEKIVSARYVVILAALALVGAAASGVIFLTVSTDYRAFFNKDNPELLALESLERVYEKSDYVLLMIVPDDGDATSEPALSAAIWLTERAWQTPYATRVDSIANFPHTTADEDWLVVQDLVDTEKAGDPQERSRIRATALADPRLAGNLVARDGAVSAVSITVKLPDGDNAASIAEVAGFAYQIVADAKEKFPGIDFRPVGTVIINQAFSDATLATSRTVSPAALAVMAVILGLMTRGMAGVVATGGVVILSVLAAMGIAGWVGIPLSTATSAVPVIVLTLAVANCLHVIVTTRQRLGDGIPKHAAVAQSVQENLNPIFLASATTAFGFLMMNFSEVPPYRQLGTLVAAGAAISFLLSVTFLPALLSVVPIRPFRPGRSQFGIHAIAEFTLRRRKPLLWLSVAVIIGLCAALPRNELNDVLTNFFGEDVQLRKDTDFLDEHLSGNTAIEYSIEADGPDGITEPAFLEDVSAFADWFRAQPETRHVLVISDTFRQLNKSLHGDDPAAYRIPEDRKLAAQLLLLYELSLPFGLDVNNRINIDKSATRMTVTTRTLSTKELLEFDARAKSWLDDSASHFSRVQSSGASLMFAHLGQRNIRAMLVGTIIAFLGISVLLVAAFRSLRLGLVSLAPNFVPVLAGFGIWGLTVGEVGLALSVVMAMTIGIVVDDTVHFLSKYLQARRELGKSPEDAVRHAFGTVGRALFATTTILVAGFLVLGTSSFAPTGQMGQLTAIVISLALAFDFLFLPPLLLALDRR